MMGPDLFSGGIRPVSLVELTTCVGNAIRMSANLQGVWVTAELSDVRISGGHCYMELVEKNSAGQTVAKLRATVWQSRFQYIRQKFYGATGRDILTGMKVMLNGSVSHHTLYGLSFTVNDIDPSYTLGDMERLRREILMRLHKEGVLYQNKGEALPVLPQRIAVISAEGAAGYGDFMNHLVGNPEGFVFYPFLVPAMMQGEKTSASVRRALDFVESTIDLWDCVAIVRGGGATTDLNGFDDYELARRVATFPLPVIVGIGHERDRTVLDEIAHTRLKTPTAVAGFFVDAARNAYELAGGLVDKVARYASERLSGEARRMANLETMVPALVNMRLSQANARLDKELGRLPVVVASRLSQGRAHLDTLGRLIMAAVPQPVAKAARRLEELESMLKISSESQLRQGASRLENLENLVRVLSPDNTLKRGYSITRVNGKAITDASQIAPGATMVTRLYDGEIESEVKGIAATGGK